MKKVITYGTYDLLHHGHIRLLERAKELGDYLVVGVTADSFDRVRGKINVFQSLTERIEGVRATGLADEIIVEEYEGQKIDDICRLGIDVFTVGSDWVGKFDYLNEYCKVVYLDRTQGVSSTEIRSESSALRLGLVGDGGVVRKYLKECPFVNGVAPSGVYVGVGASSERRFDGTEVFESYDDLLDVSDAVFVASHPSEHYRHVKQALSNGKHVLCESPLAMRENECSELFELAEDKGLVLSEAIKTAYATAYHRLLLLVKSGRIGRVVSVQAACTSLSDLRIENVPLERKWTSSAAWGPTALLPVLQLLGTDYKYASMTKSSLVEMPSFDAYGKIELFYPGATGTAMFGKAIKSEGSLVISGTEGYLYVPAPWWKTDYFEIRKEDPSQNRRFFYQLDGEGIRYELVTFARSARMGGDPHPYIGHDVSIAISKLIEQFMRNDDCVLLEPIL